MGKKWTYAVRKRGTDDVDVGTRTVVPGRGHKGRAHGAKLSVHSTTLHGIIRAVREQAANMEGG